MTAVADRLLSWCERYYVKQGTPFTTEGREWVRGELFVPTFGWKLWPRVPGKLCGACKDRIGEWVDWGPEVVEELRAHRSGGCEGLWLAPNMVTVLNLDRGAGKTTNFFALVAAAIDDPALAPFSVQFMSAAGSQSDTIIRENLIQPVESDRRLVRRFETRANRVRVQHRGRGLSFVEVVETSHRSNTGRRRNLQVFDEARDVPARSVASMLPSLKSTSKLVCPRGHSERPYEDGVFTCGVCAEVMVPRVPRVLIASTSGLDEGEGDYEWFNALVERLEGSPSPYAHLFRSEEAGNPNVSRHETEMLHEVFADVPGLRDYMAVELGNAPIRKGDSFVTKGDLRRVSDPTVENLEGSLLECVGFLDTSWSSDLTSLLICGWDPELCDRPWQQLRVLHWKLWAPKTLARGVIDPRAIEAYLEATLPLFPDLRMLMVDDRGMAWAKDLVVWANRDHARTWGRKVKAFHGKRVRGSDGRTRKQGARVPGLYGGEDDRARGWQLLEQRIATGRSAIAVPTKERLPELHRELLGAVRKEKLDGSVEIRDRNRKKRHADVADSLAGCALLAYHQQTRKSRTLAESNARDPLDDLLAPLTGQIKNNGWL